MKERRFNHESAPELTGQDFIIRRRLPPLFVIGFLFAAAYLIVLYLAHSSGARDNLWTLGIFLAFVLGGMCTFVIAFTQRNRDLVLATEFQNMLFAAAASVNSKFVIITQRDGTAVYYNPGFQRMFGGQRHMSTVLDTVMDSGNLPDPQKDKVRSVIAKSQYAQFPYHYAGDGKSRALVLYIDPLSRPRGYSLIRAIDPENHSGGEIHGTDGGASGFLLDSLLHSVPFGLYTLTPEREVTFCNESFAGMLGMECKTIIGERMSFKRLMRESEMAQLFGNREFRGEVTFIKMNGAPVRLFVKQQALVGADGEVIGYKAIIEDKTVSPLR